MSNVPRDVISELQAGLRLYERGYGGDGLRPETVKWARRMVAGEDISPEKFVLMRNWLSRHGASDAEVAARHRQEQSVSDGRPSKSPALVAWLLWGGDSAVKFTSKPYPSSLHTRSNPLKKSITAKQSKADSKKIDSTAKAILSRFNEVRTSDEIAEIVQAARESHPSKSQSDIEARAKLIKQGISESEIFAEFESEFVDGAALGRSAALNKIAGVVTGDVAVAEVRNWVGNVARKVVVAEIKAESSPVFAERGIREEILAFLPSNLNVDIDKDGTIKEFYDRLANEHKGTREKVAEFANLVRQKGDIVEQATADIANGDHPAYFGGLCTLIMLETGMRPSEQGAWFRETVRGKDGSPMKKDGKIVKKKVHVYGAVSLLKKHVSVKSGVATFAFAGKENVPNRYSTSNPVIVRELSKLLASTKSGPLFVLDRPYTIGARGKSAFSVYDYPLLDDYLKGRFDGVNANNFRKYAGTKAMWESLKSQGDALAKKIAGFKEAASETAAEAVVEAIVEALAKAAKDAATSLSHQQKETAKETKVDPGAPLKKRAEAYARAANTFINAYLNPQIIAYWLSTAKADISLDDIIDKKIKLGFDPKLWIREADKHVASKKRKNGPQMRGLDIEKDLSEVMKFADEVHKLDAGMSGAKNRSGR